MGNTVGNTAARTAGSRDAGRGRAPGSPATQRGLAVLAAVATLAVLFALCLRHALPRIQADLTGRAEVALATDFPGARVSIDGRDVSLTGAVPSVDAQQRAERLVGGLAGVRSVDNRLTIDESLALGAATSAADQQLELDWNGLRMTLRGSVPDEATRAAIVTAIAAEVGAQNVADELTLDPRIADRAAAIAPPLAAATVPLDRATTRIVAGAVSVQGRAGSAEARERVTTALRSLAAEATVAINLASAPGETAPPASAERPTTEAPPALTDSDCQTELDRLLAGERIRFAKNSADIDATSLPLLDDLAAVAMRCPRAHIEVSGHTDSFGPADWNRQLSGLRADAVAGYLIRRGVSPRRLQAKGYGSDQPIGDNQTRSGREQNRRIEFNVLGGPSG